MTTFLTRRYLSSVGEYGEWSAAYLYRAAGANHTAQLVTVKHSEKNTERGAKCTNPQEILAFYTIPPAAPVPVTRARGAANRQAVTPQPGHLLDIGKRALEQAGTIDAALKDAHVEFVD